MYPKWAGGRFFFITGSKSKTLMASFGSLIRVPKSRDAHGSGSGSREGTEASCAEAGPPPWVSNGLAAKNWRNRRRLVDRSDRGSIATPQTTVSSPAIPFALGMVTGNSSTRYAPVPRNTIPEAHFDFAGRLWAGVVHKSCTA